MKGNLQIIFYWEVFVVVVVLFCFVVFWSFVFLGLHQWHMEVLRLGVESEL